jgi:hypothetical protein
MKRSLNMTAKMPGLRAAICLAMLAMAPMAGADDHEGKHRSRVPPLPQYQQECGACHVAFPSALLPAESWQRVMNTLPRHYGVDASLDAPLQQQIGAWLAANAGSGKRASQAPPEDRITRGAWFVREHREVSAGTWALPAVKSAANCIACHVGAEQGDFSERSIRMPR